MKRKYVTPHLLVLSVETLQLLATSTDQVKPGVDSNGDGVVDDEDIEFEGEIPPATKRGEWDSFEW